MSNEQTVETAEVNPTEMYRTPRDTSSDDIEAMMVRNFSDDQRSSSIKPSPSMYSYDSPYESIPTGLRTPNREPHVYYLSNLNAAGDPLLTQRGQKLSSYESDDQSMMPTVFLEPKVISQPVLYSVVNRKPAPVVEMAPPVIREPRIPIVYTIITSQDRNATVDIPQVREIQNEDINKSPTVYSLSSPSIVQDENREPIQQLPIPKPNMYSLAGSPGRTSRGIQVDMNPTQPTPILYTVIGDTPMSTKRPTDDASSTTIRKQPSTASIYTLGDDTNTPRQQPLKQQQQQQQPTLYTLVNDPYLEIPPVSSTRPTKPLTRKSSPPAIMINDRNNRQVERESQNLDVNNTSYPINKSGYESPPPQPRDSRVQKTEMVGISRDDDEYHSRLQANRQPATFETTPNTSYRKPFATTPYRSIRHSDYRSPYALGAQKSDYDRRPVNEQQPVLLNNRPNIRATPSNREPGYRSGQRNQSDQSKSPSTRNPASMKGRSTLSNSGYQTQTDDEEEYEQKLNKKKRNTKQTQPRAPWIPVW